MENTFLRIEHISKHYGEFHALEDINVEIEEGEFVCLLGPSGCGKTTLLRIIAGLEKPTEGRIYLKGRDATDFHPSKRNFGIGFSILCPLSQYDRGTKCGLWLKRKGIEKG